MKPTTKQHFDTDVLIVGAGPTGLALAIKLRQMGLDPMLVERMESGQNTSRAAVIHAHTLDMLANIGVARDMQRDGMNLSRFSVHDRGNRLATFSFDELPTEHPGLLMIPQDRTEAILRRAYEDCGGQIGWGQEVKAMSVEGGGVRALIEVGGLERSVLARHVVGADGMHSKVREAAGIGFSGGSYEHSFVLADIEMQWPAGAREVMLFFSPEGPLVVAPLPGHQYRVVAMLANAPAQPALEDIQRVLQSRGPSGVPPQVTRLLWSSRFRLHHRVADRYRSGPFFLMGDAAHVHSPAGGQGMNTGLVDAIVLGFWASFSARYCSVIRCPVRSISTRLCAVRQPRAYCDWPGASPRPQR